ncbi:MAG: glycosyltransferase family 2 protein [Clostridia bacterium]|nr:glycosyltransferase family 2 protein [Clostridia bacterium]
MMEYPFISVVIPVRNESRYIDKCIDSIFSQTYDKSKMEIIFVDGKSSDDTVARINKRAEENDRNVIVLDNPQKITPVAMNIGIKAAKGDYIVRLDAHSEYPDTYIEQCIECILKTDADNVGGIALSDGDGYIGEAFSYLLATKFGVGDSGFRIGVPSGYVDTVPFGTFKKETFEKFGLYDERLVRNQDSELNSRINQNGGKIYLDSDIKLTYKCRNTISGIAKQNFGNGKWNIITQYLCPGAMSLRHFIPFLFVLSLVVLIPLAFTGISFFVYSLIAELALYLSLDICYSVKLSCKNGIKYLPLLMFLYPFIHICYGLGSFVGIVNLFKFKKK